MHSHREGQPLTTAGLKRKCQLKAGPTSKRVQK
jgi:hypothetical protein